MGRERPGPRGREGRITIGRGGRYLIIYLDRLAEEADGEQYVTAQAAVSDALEQPAPLAGPARPLTAWQPQSAAPDAYSAPQPGPHLQASRPPAARGPWTTQLPQR